MLEISSEDLAAAVSALQNGEVVCFPTESTYGLAVDSFNHQAVERLFALKGRGAGHSVALIAASFPQVEMVAAEWPGIARDLAARHWPGPLTLILPAHPHVHADLVSTKGVGVRISSHPVAHALAQGLGRPITATSANLSGQPAANFVSQARDSLGERVSVYLDTGRCDGLVSTVAIPQADGQVSVVRAGAISLG